MDKLIVVVVLFVLLTIKFKPPVIINSIESVIVFVRAIGLQFTYPKYFHEDPVDSKVLKFEEVLKESKPKLAKEINKWILYTKYKEEERGTQIILVNGYTKDKPTLIYHHGAGSTEPLRDFNLIFGKEYKGIFNIFVVWAQHHTSKKDYLENSVDSFIHHQQTFAGSILAYEEIIKYHKSESKFPVVATGSSMGGIVSSLHVFYFGSADYYFPIVAYPNVGEIFMGQAYKTAVSDWEAKQTNNSYFESFDIKSFDKTLTNKVFPVIGEKDKIVTSQKALDFWESRGFLVTKYLYGHFTPGIMRREIRKLILDKVGI